MTDLTPLPCPFCGGSARTYHWNGTTQATCAASYADCAGTDVRAPVGIWNRRALAVQQSGEAALHEKIATAYQIVGSLAHETGLFDHQDVQRALDYLSNDDDHAELLPWPSSPLTSADGLIAGLEWAMGIVDGMRRQSMEATNASPKDRALAAYYSGQSSAFHAIRLEVERRRPTQIVGSGVGEAPAGETPSAFSGEPQND